MTRHFVAISTDSGIELHPMKEWLRRNPAALPPHLDPTAHTTQQLRAGLRKLGWRIEKGENAIRLIPPGGPADATARQGSRTVAPEREPPRGEREWVSELVQPLQAALLRTDPTLEV